MNEVALEKGTYQDENNGTVHNSRTYEKNTPRRSLHMYSNRGRPSVEKEPVLLKLINTGFNDAKGP